MRVRQFVRVRHVECLVAVLCGAISTVGCAESGSDIAIEGSTSVAPLVQAMLLEYAEVYPADTVTLAITGSGSGVEAAGVGRADIGMASRPLKSDELMMYPGIRPTSIARDAIAVIVHPENPVNELTLNELAEIFSGQMTSWDAAGGSGAIDVFVREEGSGTRAFFGGVVLGDASFSPDAQTRDSTGDVLEAVAGDPAAIGFVSFGSIDDRVKVIGVDADRGAVLPTAESIRAEEYVITRPLLLILPSLPSEGAERFVDFALSPSAQEVVSPSGFVPVI